MKICFFSDVHGNIEALKAFWHDASLFSIDLFVFGGDIFGYYYHQNEILDFLRENGITCLLGNHDKMFLDLLDGKIDESYLVNRYGSTYRNIANNIPKKHIDFLRKLESRYDLSADGLHLAFVHGSLQDSLNGRIYPDTVIKDFSAYEGIDFVFTAHTHHKLIKILPCGTTLINPGSIGQQRDGKGCSYVIFDTKSKEYSVHIIEYDINKLIKEIKSKHEESEMEKKLIEVLLRK